MRVLELAKSKLSQLRRSELAENTAKLCMGQGLRLVIQAAYFILIARSLGPKEYGTFVAMTSLVAIAAPFAGFGSPTVLLKNVSRQRDLLATYWGNGLLTIAVSGSILSMIVLALTPFFLGRQFFLLTILVCLSDLFMIRVAELAAFAFAALGRMGESARVNVYITLTKLIGIVILSAKVQHPTVQDWTIAYVLGAAACFLYALVRTTLVAGGVDIRPRQAWSDVPESALYAVSTSSTTIYNDLDKTMVGKFSTFTAAGIYAAAYRIIDVSLVPVRAMLFAAYPEFFRIGVDGPSATKRYAYRLIKEQCRLGYCHGRLAVGRTTDSPHPRQKLFIIRRGTSLACDHTSVAMCSYLPGRWANRGWIPGEAHSCSGGSRGAKCGAECILHSPLVMERRSLEQPYL